MPRIMATLLLITTALAARSATDEGRALSPNGDAPDTWPDIAHMFPESSEKTNTQCLDGSDTFTLSADAQTSNSTFARTMLADYPSTGSTWLLRLVNSVANATGTAPAGCAIYGEYAVKVDEDTYCPDTNMSERGAALVKTHFPAQDQYRRKSLADSRQYGRSMRLDRLVVLLRHPLAAVRSNIKRWRGSTSTQASNLECWANWWGRAARALPASSVHVLRYEDLCTDTAGEVARVIAFLGSPLAEQGTLPVIERMLTETPSLACSEHTDHAAPYTAAEQSMLKRWTDRMQAWGYGNASAATSSTAAAGRRATGAVVLAARAPAAEVKLNPWLLQ
mgnify:CR=1 FL=1